MVNKIEQALIAGGGKGNRIGKLVGKYGNKSLIKVKGKPIIYYTVDWLRKAGIKRILITLNYEIPSTLLNCDSIEEAMGSGVIRTHGSFHDNTSSLP